MNANAPNCLMCHRRESDRLTGQPYNAKGANGMVLFDVWVCDACAPVPRNPALCAACRKPQAADRPGTTFQAVGVNGVRLPPFWLCNEDAFRAGPQQGPIDAFKGSGPPPHG